MSKRADAAYAPGNRGLWLKVKCLYREEFVVVGWTDPEGRRGIVRLWMLDGKPAAEPFRGHDEAVLSVAFSPDGTRIVSGQDGIVLLWDIAAATVSTLYFCGADLGLGFVDMRFFWIGCSDRISIQSASFKPRGDLFLNKEGLFTSVYSEGVNVPNDRLQDPFHAVASGGYVIWQRRAVPDISVERVRQVLLDEWTLRERIYEFARRTYKAADESYAALGWWKVPFWPALGWLIAILAAVGTWIVVPHKLAHWAMPSVGSPEIPTWKWLSGVLTLFGYLGTTRRPLTAWLRKNRDALLEQNFTGRTPVKEREKYCNIMHEVDIAAFDRDLSASGSVRVWITGVGGSGKSALAYRMLRVAAEHKTSALLPILVDEDWDKTLLDHVGQQLTVHDRCPTQKMVEILGARGRLCLLMDSLSERGMAEAVAQVADAIRKGVVKSIVVTSRQPRPDGRVWQEFKTVIARPVTVEQAPDYVATYAPEYRRPLVLKQIAPLITRSVSPLFLRFAIEQALVGEVSSTSTLDLVLQYVEALRAGRVDLSADDMLRAASITATEGSPREPRAAPQTVRGMLDVVLVAGLHIHTQHQSQVRQHALRHASGDTSSS